MQVVQPKLSMPVRRLIRLQIDEAWWHWGMDDNEPVPIIYIYTHVAHSRGRGSLEGSTNGTHGWPGWPCSQSQSEEAAAERRGLQEGDERQDGDGDEEQSHEDVLVDGEQAHLPHDMQGSSTARALATALVRPGCVFLVVIAVQVSLSLSLSRSTALSRQFFL